MRSNHHVRQQAGTVGENPVRIERGKAEQVVEALSIDLAGTFVLSHQLQKHYWTISGAEHCALNRIFREAADDTAVIVDDLADRIQALGGVPLAGPAALEHHSPIPFEGEHVYDIRTSITNDLQAYGDLIEQVSSHIELAESYGDHATAEILRHHLIVLEEYTGVLGRLLYEDSLTAW